MTKKMLLILLSAALLHFSMPAGTWDPTEPEKFGTELDTPTKLEIIPESNSTYRVWSTFGPQSPELFEWLINEMKVDKKKLQEKLLSLTEEHFKSCPKDELGRLFAFPQKK